MKILPLYQPANTSFAYKNLSYLKNTTENRLYKTNPVAYSERYNVAFKALPVDICYTKQIISIENMIKKSHIKPHLLFDGSERNFAMAVHIQDCLKKIKEKLIDFPKMDIYINNWGEIFDNRKTAAVTDVVRDKGHSVIEMIFNTPSYKYSKLNKTLYRLKAVPFDTSFDIDFFHEFTHSYQAYFNYDNYSKIKKEFFDEETAKEITEKISAYATTDKSEFVAEYFAYKMMGKEIKSNKLDKLYKDLLGPEI